MVENHHAARFHPLAALLLLIMATSLTAQTNPPVRYTVRFPAPATHYVSVEAILPAAGRPSIEVFMPVWTPGSYLVREYARNVEATSAADALPAKRSPFPNRARIAG